MKSFKKQTQGSNLARNALQRESCTRQFGFLCCDTWCPQATPGLLATASADDLFPTPAFGVQFGMGRARFEQILAALFFLVQLMMVQTPGLQQLQGHSSTYICASAWHPLFGAPSLYTVWTVILISKLLSFLVTKGQDELSNKQKSAYFKHFHDLGMLMTSCLNVLPEALPAGQELRSAIIKGSFEPKLSVGAYGESEQNWNRKTGNLQHRSALPKEKNCSIDKSALISSFKLAPSCWKVFLIHAFPMQGIARIECCIHCVHHALRSSVIDVCATFTKLQYQCWFSFLV